MTEIEKRKKARTQILAGDRQELNRDPVWKVQEPVAMVIFGASGDLCRRKLMPALFQLDRGGFLPERYMVLGVSRTPMSDEAFRQTITSTRPAQGNSADAGTGPACGILPSLFYFPMDISDLEAYRQMKIRLEELERENGLSGNRLFYLAVAPELFTIILNHLAAAGLIHAKCEACWSRVIIEKPFGRDWSSARALNAEVTSLLDENQVYRIDHYLGKETVQNLLGFRFGNSIFEPLFNQKYVDHIQITVAETLGMEGRRGAYFDRAGILRDLVQNHMLQLLCLIAMEPPAAVDAQSIRDEKVKVLRALMPMRLEEVAGCTVRGQYDSGEWEGQAVKAYRGEDGVQPNSTTESYVALRLRIDNWRWAGIPFYLRAGKRLRTKVTEIAVQFRRPPLHLFRHGLQIDSPEVPALLSNMLVLRIQPDEGISLSFACKRPGMQFRLDEVEMDFFYRQGFSQRPPEAYERLLLDALRGDASLFTRSDEVEYAWRFISSIHEGWAALPSPAFPNYHPFSDGPQEAAQLMSGTETRWRPLRNTSGEKIPGEVEG